MTETNTANRPLELLLDESVSATMEINAIDFRLHGHGVSIMSNGVEKHISLESFLSALASSSSNNSDGNDEGLLLPSNTFFVSQSVTRLNLSCYYQGGIRNLKYFTHDRPSVIPNIIVSHSLKKNGGDWTMDTSRYFCTDKPVSGLPAKFINSADPAAHVFGMPFSNTYHDNRMCYGGNSMPHVFRNNNLRGLDWYYQFLFETPFNDDLGINPVEGRVSPSSWYTKLAELAEQGEAFPYHLLSGYSGEQPAPF